MPRKKLTLSLPDEVFSNLEAVRLAFGQDEPEETIATLVGLGRIAVSVSSIQNPKIELCNFEDRTKVAGFILPTK